MAERGEEGHCGGEVGVIGEAVCDEGERERRLR